MEMTYAKVTKEFIYRSSRRQGCWARGAGFTWDSGRRVWFTTDPKIAVRLSRFATSEVRALCGVAACGEKLGGLTIASIHYCLKLLAGLDPDYAKEENGCGFNSGDTGIGHTLAGLPELTNEQALMGQEILGKYRHQLPKSIYSRHWLKIMLDFYPQSIIQCR